MLFVRVVDFYRFVFRREVASDVPLDQTGTFIIISISILIIAAIVNIALKIALAATVKVRHNGAVAVRL